MSAFSIVVLILLSIQVLFDGLLMVATKADEAARGTALINFCFAVLAIIALAVRG